MFYPSFIYLQYPYYLKHLYILCICLSLILTSTGQVIFQVLVSHEFYYTTRPMYLVNIILSICLLPIFGLPLLWGYWKYGGYVVDMKNVLLRRSFICIGLFNTLGRTMELLSIPETIVISRISIGYLIIPFILGFILTTSSSFYKLFSLKGMFGCGMIIFGSFGHVCLSYLTTSIANGPNKIFWQAINLLSIIPFSISSLSQQQCYSIRRLNVFYFLYYATIYQFIFQCILWPFQCFQGTATFQVSQLFTTFSQFLQCLMSNELSIPNYCISPMYARYFIFFYIAFSIISQLLQILLVRRCTFEQAATTMLSIPAFIFLIFFSLSTYFTTTFLSLCIGNNAVIRLQQSQTFFSSPYSSSQGWIYLFIFFFHLIAFIGTVLYRLCPSNQLKEDYTLPPDTLFDQHQNVFQLFAPFLQSGCPKTADDIYNHYYSTIGLFFPSHKTVHVPNSVSGSIPLYISQNSSNPSFSHNVIEKPAELYLPTIQTLPYYLPSPMPQHRPLRVMVRPTLMNLWSGNIMSEYTDYKKWNDCEFSPHWIRCSAEDTRDYPIKAFRPLSCSVWKQYTQLHLEQLSYTEDALKKLYAYHSIGTLAASMVAQATILDSQNSSSRSSSSHTYRLPGRVAEEDSDVSYSDLVGDVIIKKSY